MKFKYDTKVDAVYIELAKGDMRVRGKFPMLS